MELLKTIRTYASLVRFPHTVFALPFAAIGYFYAVQEQGFSGWLLLKVLLCMVLARNSAMGFNRYADRRIDALNPRTAAREIPRGAVTPKNALGFVIVNGALFIAVAAWINPLCLLLSPVALIVILGYSLTKRFTSLSHLFLGLSLAIAPAGAYIAVTGTLTEAPVLLSALVLTWSGGFDIIYSLQDIAFDRQHGLNSLPARLGARGALWVSAILHLLTLALVLWVAPYWGGNGYARIGSLAFIGLLIYQHLIIRPTQLDRIGLAFGTLNGIASIVYALGVILGFY